MKNKKIFLYFLPALLVTLIIFALSSRDIEASNAQSGQVTETVASLFGSSASIGAGESPLALPLDILNLYIRSLAHVIEFGGLGLMLILGALLAKFSEKVLIRITLIWGCSAALLDEIIQYFTPGRTCDILDITKDIIGILLALVFAYVVKKVMLYLKDKKSLVYAK